MKIEMCIEDIQRKSKPNTVEIRLIQNTLYKKIKEKEIKNIAESINESLLNTNDTLYSVLSCPLIKNLIFNLFILVFLHPLSGHSVPSSLSHNSINTPN